MKEKMHVPCERRATGDVCQIGKLTKPATLRKYPALVEVTDAKPSSMKECSDCLAMGGQTWVHLNMCRICGHVGCCDNSPNKHATAHFHSTGHAIIQRFEPGEDWGWDYETQAMIEPFPAEIATGARHISIAEGYRMYSPKKHGPSGRVVTPEAFDPSA